MPQASREMLESRSREAGFVALASSPDCFLAAAPGTQALPIAEHGFVIGHLFAAGSRHEVTALTPQGAATIVSSGGERLIEAFWGDYIAIWRTADGFALLRGPFGNLPCLHATLDTGLIAGSDIAALRHAGLHPLSIDYDAVARQLIAGDLRTRETCLAGIAELRGGGRMTLANGRAQIDSLWSPWTFTTSTRRIDDEEEACEGLRRHTNACIAARTSRLEKPLLMLSGGLDSSILAASLGIFGRRFACLTFATADRIGDERDEARAVAAHLGQEIVERKLEPAGVDIARLAATGLPRPSARSFEQHVHGIARDLAAELGCDGVLDGGGGDNVFCSLQSAAPAADCLLAAGGSGHFWQVCDDMGELASASRWTVAWRALRRACAASRAPLWPLDLRFLTQDAKAHAMQAARHPWLMRNPVRLPGRGAHIALLAAAQGYIEDGPHGTKTASLSPLLSQPLIEHCLSIPSWLWLARGCNRAAARMAYADRLPAQIAWRRDKGAPDSFLIALLDHNRALIREYLAGGLLQGAGVIEPALVLEALDDPRPARGTDYRRLMRLFDTESWARGVAAAAVSGRASA
ncbi:asparagine synthase-related protein [Novosphingobium naphthalenivorans]|uniref:asparagine synthase-related protein n=1 Tax=Novosphingobium naphthalenivorans TaxID=273168 RepID=UPI000A024A4D|nr:asparagine synthetase B family protein [Novosphingobium naphthalenivorans]